MSENEFDWPEGLVDITERLVICEFIEADAPALYKLLKICSPGTATDLQDITFEDFSERHRSYIKYQYGFYGYGLWGVFLRENDAAKSSDGAARCYTYPPISESPCYCGQLIGVVGVINGSDSGIGEISYAILPEYRRQGFAYEACKSALSYAEECGFTSFEAKIHAENPASIELARKIGVRII